MTLSGLSVKNSRTPGRSARTEASSIAANGIEFVQAKSQLNAIERKFAIGRIDVKDTHQTVAAHDGLDASQ